MRLILETWRYIFVFFFRLFGNKILLHFVDIGKKPPVFQDAAQVALAILEQEFDHGQLFYNKYK